MTDGISFGKNRNIDFKGFNGIRKQDFKAEQGSKKEQLIKALFENKKYNKNNDNILSYDDLELLEKDIIAAANSGKSGRLGKSEAKEFIKNNLGLDGDFTRDDLYELLNEINADTDSVEDVSTDSERCVISVKYKPDVQGRVKTEYYAGSENNLQHDVVQDKDTRYTTFYDKKGNPYSRHVTKGAVTEIYDCANGNRLIHKSTAIGNDMFETEEYEYGEKDKVTKITTHPDKSKVVLNALGDDVYTITKYDALGNKISHSMKNGENSFDTVYTYNDDKTRTETSTWKNGTVTRAVYDSQNNLQSRVNVDENGNPQSYTHKVDKENDTWYGIVQAKYGITDHKTTLEIVHRLKDAAGVKYSAVTIPDEIELPAEINLKNGNIVSLNDVFGTIDQTHNVQTHINIVNSDNIPENMEVSADKKSIDYLSLPIAKQPEKQIDIQKILQKYPQNANNANKTVQSGDNWLEYDEQGRVVNIYDHKPTERTDFLDTVESFYYKNDGSLDGYITRTKVNDIVYERGYDADGNLSFINNNKFDDNGNIIESYESFSGDAPYYTVRSYGQNGSHTIFFYNSEGNLTNIQDDEHDNSGKLTRTNFYNANGELQSFHDKSYDDLGREKHNTIYNSDGTVHEVHITKYKPSSYSQWHNAEYYRYDNKGNLIK